MRDLNSNTENKAYRRVCEANESGMKFSQIYAALNFWFFCFKTKEQNDLITNPGFLLIFISANLVEGYGRASQKDKAHFTNVSYSSALETLDHLITSYDVEYLKNEDYLRLRSELSGIIAMLNGLYKYQSKQNHNLRDHLN